MRLWTVKLRLCQHSHHHPAIQHSLHAAEKHAKQASSVKQQIVAVMRAAQPRALSNDAAVATSLHAAKALTTALSSHQHAHDDFAAPCTVQICHTVTCMLTQEEEHRNHLATVRRNVKAGVLPRVAIARPSRGASKQRAWRRCASNSSTTRHENRCQM